VIVVFAVSMSVSLFFPSRGEVLTISNRISGGLGDASACRTDRTSILMAQAVPSATKLPCVGTLPLGWTVTNATVVRGRATFAMGVGQGDSSFVVEVGTPPVIPLVELTFSRTCDQADRARATRVFDVPGGCIAYRSSVPSNAAVVPSFDPGGGLTLVSRSSLVSFVQREEGLRLCGAGVPCP
jgi:hypothetical protein